MNEIIGDLFNVTEYNDYAKSVLPDLDIGWHGWMSKNNTRNGHLIPDGYPAWPVNTFTNHRGHRFHHIAIPDSLSGQVFHRMGFANPDKNFKRDCDGCFEDEYFSDGGLDWTACDGGIGEHLNSGDFNQMEPELECYLSEQDTKDNSGIEFQIYTSSPHGTLGAGSIAAFNSDGDTYLPEMDYCPNGIPSGGCGSTQESSG